MRAFSILSALFLTSSLGAAYALDEIVVQAARPTERALRFTAPVLPSIYRDDPKEAWIHLKLVLTATGDVSDVKLVESYPRTLFNDTVMKTARGWKFEPRREGGTAVPDPSYDLAVSIYNDKWETYRDTRSPIGRGRSTRGITALNLTPFRRILSQSSPDDPAVTSKFFDDLQTRLDANDLNVSEVARYFAFRTRFNRMNGRFDYALGDARRTLLLAEFLDNGKLVLAMHIEILASLTALNRNDDAVDYYDSWRASATTAPIPEALAADMESRRAEGAGKGKRFTIVDFDETHKHPHRPQTDDAGSLGVDLKTIELNLPAPAGDTPLKWVPLGKAL